MEKEPSAETNIQIIKERINTPIKRYKPSNPQHTSTEEAQRKLNKNGISAKVSQNTCHNRMVTGMLTVLRTSTLSSLGS